MKTVYYECGYDNKGKWECRKLRHVTNTSLGTPYTKQVDSYGKPVDNKDAYQTWASYDSNGKPYDKDGKPVTGYNTWSGYDSSKPSSVKPATDSYNTWSSAYGAPQTWSTVAAGYATPAAAGTTWNDWNAPTATGQIAKYTGGAQRNAAGLLAGVGLAALLL